MNTENKITIGSKSISNDTGAYIIAEIGMNHNGDIGLAKDMIKAAARSGADAVKFQSFRTEDFLSERFFDFEERKKYELSSADHLILYEEAESNNVEFLSTPLDEYSLNMLDDLEVNAFKVASCDLNNLPFIRKIAEKYKPVIFSTGYGLTNEINNTYELIKEYGCKQIAIMHCVAAYPTNYNDINLNNIGFLKKSYKGALIGFSDHSMDYLNIPSIAVSMGARIIEKHFTLDQNLPGYDHHMSLDEKMFTSMVNNIRNAELSLGKTRLETGLIGDENERVNNARRSLFWSSDLKKGTELKEQHILAKRPGRGLSPDKLSSIIGKKTINDIQKDTLVDLKDVE